MLCVPCENSIFMKPFYSKCASSVESLMPFAVGYKGMKVIVNIVKKITGVSLAICVAQINSIGLKK